MSRTAGMLTRLRDTWEERSAGEEIAPDAKASRG